MCRLFLLLVLLNVATQTPEVAEVQPSHGVVQTQCIFQDQAKATVEYVSMTRNGRKIFGGVVPYGKPWGMGDQRPPTFTAGADLVVEGMDVPAGRYSLVMIPRPERWTLIFQKMNGQRKPTETDEAARVDLRVEKLRTSRESFEIVFDQHRGGCVLNLRWEESEASMLVARK